LSKHDDPEELQEVLACIDPFQAQMARDLLTEAGIEVFLFDSDSSRMLGSIGAVPTRIMVHADKAVEAREALKDLGFES